MSTKCGTWADNVKIVRGKDKGMHRHVIVLIMSVLALSAAVIGCAEEHGRWTTNTKVLDQKVVKLKSGITIEAVRSELGKPAWEFSNSKEAALHYGLWQLVFSTAGRLENRTRYYKPRHRTTDIKTLKRKVMKLKLGASIEHVSAMLGIPEAIEIYRNPPHKEESLWYGNGRWKLDFIAGTLTHRTTF